MLYNRVVLNNSIEMTGAMQNGGSANATGTVSTANASTYASGSGPNLKAITRVAFLGGLGSYFEYFDFFIALLATGIAWPVVFFSGVSPAVGLALSLFSYALTFFTRPVGAYIFGHYGDRLGRKYVLFLTLLIMGLGSLGIASLPGVTAIGAAAPILLSVIRLIQGIGLGGEAGGASTWVLEVAARSKHRGFWTSWVQAGSPAGLATAALLTSSLLSFQGRAVFLDWGWRVPFIVGGIVAVIGGILRYRLMESPLFERVVKTHKVERYPASQVIKKQWKKLLLLLQLNYPEVICTSVTVVPFSVLFMIQMHVSPTFASGASVYLGIGALVGTIVAGILSDYIGRKIFFILAGLLGAVFAYPFFIVLQTRSEPLIILLMFGWGFMTYLENAVLPSLLTESYETKWRYSGASLSMQLSIFISGAVIGFVLPAVLATSKGVYANVWPSVAGITIVMCLITFFAALFIKDTTHVIVDDTSLESIPAREVEGADE